MYDLMREVLEIPPPFNMIIVIVFLGCLSGVIGTIAKEIRKFAVHRAELEMKRDLIDRGLPADEIERIVKAGQGSNRSK